MPRPDLTTNSAIARNNPMRVLHVSSGNLYGGVETLLVTLARFRHLCPPMEPHFAVAFEGRLSEELKAAGVAVHLLGGARASRPWTVWRARRRLAQLLRQQSFDVVVCHMAWPMAMFGNTAARLGCKLAFWAHDVPDGRHWLERWARRVMPDAVIVNSRFTEKSVPKLYPDTLRRVIYYPVAVKEVGSARLNRDAARRELSVADDTAVIIQVSRMEPWKGHALHLEALSHLKNLSSKWVCWIVGGPQRPEEKQYLRGLREMADRFGIADHVRFLGQRTDVPQLLAAADIFCQPNRNPEPFGIVFIEALAAGLPVVATAMGAAPEIVDQSCGLLAPPHDAAALAASLAQCVQSAHLRQTLARNGPERARTLCDPATQLTLLQDFLRSIAAPASSPESVVGSVPA
jgi:glycosyltransferase involved in cell wall biosynthesis